MWQHREMGGFPETIGLSHRAMTLTRTVHGWNRKTGRIVRSARVGKVRASLVMGGARLSPWWDRGTNSSTAHVDVMAGRSIDRYTWPTDLTELLDREDFGAQLRASEVAPVSGAVPGTG